tara:strand:- start:770 stop:1006 length:237 start_codon:yes stop_codon:yes gene_type:complete
MVVFFSFLPEVIRGFLGFLPHGNAVLAFYSDEKTRFLLFCCMSLNRNVKAYGLRRRGWLRATVGWCCLPRLRALEGLK